MNSLKDYFCVFSLFSVYMSVDLLIVTQLSVLFYSFYLYYMSQNTFLNCETHMDVFISITFVHMESIAAIL